MKKCLAGAGARNRRVVAVAVQQQHKEEGEAGAAIETNGEGSRGESLQKLLWKKPGCVFFCCALSVPHRHWLAGRQRGRGAREWGGGGASGNGDRSMGGWKGIGPGALPRARELRPPR